VPVDTQSVQPVQPAPLPVSTGYYSCTDLERLWEKEGGNPDDSFVAAEIATAESGGNSDAISPVNWNGLRDYGLWQIDGDPDAINPVVAARVAISLSDNGSDWNPWTTYLTGAYIGRC
jgi:hypothetical protein